MKKLILTCALISFVSVMSYGQNANATHTAALRTAHAEPEKLAQMRADKYKQQLNLTPEQYKGVYAAELELAKQQQFFTANGQPMPEGPAQQMMITHDQRFQQALTTEQYAKYEKTKQVRPASMAAPHATPANH